MYSIRIFSIDASICLFLVLPLNYFGQDVAHELAPRESLEIFTIKNFKEGSQWYDTYIFWYWQSTSFQSWVFRWIRMLSLPLWYTVQDNLHLTKCLPFVWKRIWLYLLTQWPSFDCILTNTWKSANLQNFLIFHSKDSRTDFASNQS